MMTKEELLWAYSHEQREIGCSVDQQRTAVTNFIMTLTAGLIAVISVQGFGERTVAVAAFIMVLGIYGMLTTRKLYERSFYHFYRSRECLDELDRLVGEGTIQTVKSQAGEKSKEQFPYMSKMANHQVWMGLHFLIFVFGLGALLATVIN